MSDTLWKKQERKFAKAFGTTRNWLSRTKGGCEDIETDRFILDIKSTIGKKMITIKKEDLDKILDRAKQLNKHGFLGFSFYQSKRKFLIIDLSDFFELIGEPLLT